MREGNLSKLPISITPHIYHYHHFSILNSIVTPSQKAWSIIFNLYPKMSLRRYEHG
jgi:hypothetical protein